MSLAGTGLVVLGVLTTLELGGRLLRKLHRLPAPACIGSLLDSWLRKLVQPPATVIRRSGIARGMRVLEIGCGSGAFTTGAARTTGPSGSVCALDVQPRMLRRLQDKIRKAVGGSLSSISSVQARAGSLPFKGTSLDLVFLVAVLQEVPDRIAALREVSRVLRAGGVLAVTEFLPDPDYPLKSTTVDLCRRAGFLLEQVQGSFWNYTARFTKP